MPHARLCKTHNPKLPTSPVSVGPTPTRVLRVTSKRVQGFRNWKSIANYYNFSNCENLTLTSWYTCLSLLIFASFCPFNSTVLWNYFKSTRAESGGRKWLKLFKNVPDTVHKLFDKVHEYHHMRNKEPLFFKHCFLHLMILPVISEPLEYVC